MSNDAQAESPPIAEARSGPANARAVVARTILLTASLVAIMAAYIGHGFNADRETAILHARETAETYAHIVAESTSRVLDSVDHVLTEVTDELDPNDDIARLDHGRIARHALRNVTAGQRRIDVVIYGPDGTPHFSLRRDVARMANAADIGFFRHHRDIVDLQTIYGPPFTGPTSGDIIVPISRRLTGADGNFAGVIVAGSLPALFQQSFHSIHLDSSAWITITHRDGTMLVREPPAPDRGNAAAAIAATRQLEGRPLYVTVGLDMAAVLAPWAASVLRHIVGSAILIAGIAWLARRQIRSDLGLLRSNDRLESILRTMAEGLLVIRTDGNVITANPAAAAILGAPFERLLRANLHRDTPRVIDADQRPVGGDDWATVTALRHGTVTRGRVVGLVRPGAAPRWISVNAAPVHGRDGRIDAAVLTFGDVTERHEAELALKRSRQRLEGVFGVLAEGVTVRDGHGTIIDANPAAMQILGRPREDIVGARLHPDAVLPWRPVDETGRPLADRNDPIFTADAGGTAIKNRIIGAHRPDGTRRWLSVNNRTARNDDGSVAFVVSSFADITERRRIENVRAAELHALTLAAANAPLPEILAALCVTFERDFPTLICSILVADAEARTLHHGAAPSLPEPYCAAVEGIAFGTDQGCCGTAAFRRRQVIVADIASDPLWERYRPLAARYGLGACWSTPLFGDGERLIGTLAIYARTPHVPTAEELAATDNLSRIAALAIDRVRGREAMQRSEERYRRLVEFLPTPLIVVRRGGRIVDANAAACRLFAARTPEEIIGRDYDDVVHPVDRGEVRQRRSRHGDEPPAPAQLERRYVAFDGRELICEVSTGSIGGASRHDLILAIHDVTDRRASERAARDYAERLQLVSDNLPLLVGYVDTEERMRFINRTGAQWFGRPPEAIVGRRLEELFDAERSARRREAVARALAGEPVHFEGTFARADGMTRLTESTFVPHIVEGRARGYFDFTHDITERVRTEEQLRQAQKMEAVGQLTGGIAHDFNNLLAIIMGNLELIADRHEAGSALAMPVERALRATRRGAELTRRLLAFSRSQTLQPERIAVNALVRSTIDLLGRTLGRNIQVSTRLAEDVGAVVVDPGQLENALLNLAVNARDAMARGGRLLIETANVELDADNVAPLKDVAAGPYVMIAVSDTGEGMAPEIAARAFEPFFTTKAVGKGSGLGLSMVYGFVKQSGGHVAIYSEPGRGTTVRLYLPRPAGDDAGAAAAEPPAQGREGSGQRILVVEDDGDVRQLVADQLAQLGYEVRAVADGAAALALLADQAPVDLLLSDVVLAGGISGAETAARARALRPGLPVIYMSGYAEGLLGEDTLRAEGTELLQKPFTKDQLARALAAALERNEGAR